MAYDVKYMTSVNCEARLEMGHALKFCNKTVPDNEVG